MGGLRKFRAYAFFKSPSGFASYEIYWEWIILTQDANF